MLRSRAPARASTVQSPLRRAIVAESATHAAALIPAPGKPAIHIRHHKARLPLSEKTGRSWEWTAERRRSRSRLKQEPLLRTNATRMPSSLRLRAGQKLFAGPSSKTAEHRCRETSQPVAPACPSDRHRTESQSDSRQKKMPKAKDRPTPPAKHPSPPFFQDARWRWRSRQSRPP